MPTFVITVIAGRGHSQTVDLRLRCQGLTDVVLRFFKNLSAGNVEAQRCIACWPRRRAATSNDQKLWMVLTASTALVAVARTPNIPGTGMRRSRGIGLGRGSLGLFVLARNKLSGRRFHPWRPGGPDDPSARSRASLASRCDSTGELG
jgi:hypothetical protein